MSDEGDEGRRRGARNLGPAGARRIRALLQRTRKGDRVARGHLAAVWALADSLDIERAPGVVHTRSNQE